MVARETGEGGGGDCLETMTCRGQVQVQTGVEHCSQRWTIDGLCDIHGPLLKVVPHIADVISRLPPSHR